MQCKTEKQKYNPYLKLMVVQMMMVNEDNDDDIDGDINGEDIDGNDDDIDDDIDGDDNDGDDDIDGDDSDGNNDGNDTEDCDYITMCPQKTSCLLTSSKSMSKTERLRRHLTQGSTRESDNRINA